MRTFRTEAIVRSAYSRRINANIVNHSAEKYVLAGGRANLDITLNRYLVEIPDAFYRPSDSYVMDRSTKSIITPEMITTETDPSRPGFGSAIEVFPDGRRIIEVTDGGGVVHGPVICVSHWNSFSAQVNQIFMGIAQCDDQLGTELPILVPDDMVERERLGLLLIGVDESRLIKVPRNAMTRVTNAIVPSKSYVRSIPILTNQGTFELGYFLEPNNLRIVRERIRSRLLSTRVATDGAAPVVYIARRDAKGRRVTNEQEIVDALAKFGVRYITTTETPMATTCQAVMDARVVICPHGSALLNFIPASSRTTLIEIDHVGNDWLGRAICRVQGSRYRLASRPPSELRDFSNYTDRAVDVGEVVDMVAEEFGRHS